MLGSSIVRRTSNSSQTKSSYSPSPVDVFLRLYLQYASESFDIAKYSWQISFVVVGAVAFAYTKLIENPFNWGLWSVVLGGELSAMLLTGRLHERRQIRDRILKLSSGYLSDYIFKKDLNSIFRSKESYFAARLLVSRDHRQALKIFFKGKHIDGVPKLLTFCPTEVNAFYVTMALFILHVCIGVLSYLGYWSRIFALASN